MRRLVAAAAWLVGPMVLLAGCRTTGPAFQDWRDDAGFRAEAASRTFPAPIDLVAFEAKVAAVRLFETSALEIAAKPSDSSASPAEKSASKSGTSRRVKAYNAESFRKSPLGRIGLEIDSGAIEVDSDSLSIRHARLLGKSSDGRKVRVRIDPSSESEGVVVAVCVGAGPDLDGAAAQAFLDVLARALQEPGTKLDSRDRARLFEIATVLLDGTSETDAK